MQLWVSLYLICIEIKTSGHLKDFPFVTLFSKLWDQKYWFDILFSALMGDT